MPISGPAAPAVAVSAPGELAWIAGLLSGRAVYCEPALGELAGSLLPGIDGRLPEFSARLGEIFTEVGPEGCVDILVLAQRAGGLREETIEPFFERFEEAARRGSGDDELEFESRADRRGIQARLRQLARDPATRTRYREWLVDAWSLIGPTWRSTGLTAAKAAAARLERRFAAGESLAEAVSPRHPLAAAKRAGSAALELLETRPVVVAPLYFCMSGGHLLDIGGLVHLGLPASGLAPIRKAADAMYAAHLARVLNEHSRVLVLIDLLTAESSVGELARRLDLAQPTVSTHVKQLLAAGLVSPLRRGARTLYRADRRRVQGLLDDIGSVLLKWERERPR